MISVEELVSAIDPENTTLFLGAGACKNSGGLLGSELEEELRKRLDPSVSQSDLATTSAVLEKRKGRRVLVQEVRKILAPLKANDDLIAVALYDWKAIFTTNYDTLIEDAFRVQQRPLSVIRNNKDFSNIGRGTTVVDYFKLHGCISADVVDEDSSSRLVLTESDYDKYADYRECLMSAFGTYVSGGMTIICGHSLRDRHLTDILRKAVEVHRGASSDHKIFLLGRKEEEEFIEIQEGRGFIGCASSLTAFITALKKRLSGLRKRIETSDHGIQLTGKLKRSAKATETSLTEDIRDRRFFAGFTATIAQINARLTFPRSVASTIADKVADGDEQFVSITGPSGSGKTTVGRQACLKLHHRAIPTWELEELATVDIGAWQAVASELNIAKRRGMLFVPNCASQLQNINSLVSNLVSEGQNALAILVTADSLQWIHRIKARGFSTHGKTYSATSLSQKDIEYIANSYVTLPTVEQHVEPTLLGASVPERLRILKQDCKYDVVVALSRIFRNRYIKEEIVDEYRRLRASDELVENRAAEIYSTVSAIEAAGSVAERQLVHRITGYPLSEITEILKRLDETVMETDMPTGIGAYIWHTRHRVIAEILAGHNLRSSEDWRKLIRKIANAVNPALQHELSIFRRLLSSRFAIEHLGSKSDRIDLFHELLQKFPGERFLWHRLVSTYRAEGTLVEARHALEEAKRVVGIDPPLARYELLMLKDEATDTRTTDTDEERVAMLRTALDRASRLTDRFSDDKYMYDAYAQIAYELLKLGEEEPARELVLDFLFDAREDLLDPDFDKITAPTIAKLRAL